MNSLASQYGKEALRAAYKAWEANESAELLWPQMAQMAIAQPQPQQQQALLMPPAPAPAPVAAEEPQQEQPVVPVPVAEQALVRRGRPDDVFQLVSEEELARITQQIDEGHLRSQKKQFSWNMGARHHPASERQQEIISVLRRQDDRSATKERLMESLSQRWTWAYQAGRSPAGEFIGELVRQGIVTRI